MYIDTIMKITFNLISIGDPNTLGELLRKYCFVGDGHGCYDSFELRPEFEKCEPDQTIVELCCGEYEEKENISGYRAGSLEVYWFWDGDGTLVFRTPDFLVVNYDCKKDWGWTFGRDCM